MKRTKEPTVIHENAIYTAEEIAEILNCQTKTVAEYVRTGKIRGTKLGGVKILGKDLLNAFEYAS